ncbi:MAG: hypothetical protein V1703_00535 [Candidatus Altiarchaeota archaeon]
MSDAIENEIYQELYAIRSLLQSMDIRSEVLAVRQELQKVNAQLAALNKSAGVSTDTLEEAKQKPRGAFGFLR